MSNKYGVSKPLWKGYAAVLDEPPVEEIWREMKSLRGPYKVLAASTARIATILTRLIDWQVKKFMDDSTKSFLVLTCNDEDKVSKILKKLLKYCKNMISVHTTVPGSKADDNNDTTVAHIVVLAKDD